MAGLRRTWTGLLLGSAIFAMPVLGQQAASVSLTHTVSVTVPPRVKVQVGSVAPTVRSSDASVGALSIRIDATQSWMLSIESDKSHVQWLSGANFSFTGVTPTSATIASRGGSLTAADTMHTFRNVDSSIRSGSNGGVGDTIVLTVIAP